MLNKEQTIENKPGLRDYWQIFLRRKWLLILPVVIITAIAIPGSFLLPPLYQASTTLVTDINRGSYLLSFNTPRGDELSTIRYKIESRKYMKQVADKVGISEYLKSIGKPYSTDDVIRYLRSIVSMRSLGAGILEISVLHPKPDVAKIIADAVASNYVNETMVWRQNTAAESMSFIGQELENYKKKLQDSETALISAQQIRAPEILSGDSSSWISEVAKLRANLVEVEMDLQEANSELQYARKLTTDGVSEDYFSSTFVDPEITDLEAKLSGLQEQYKKLSERYTDQYPQVRAVKDSIIETQNALNKARAKFNTQQRNAPARIQYWSDRIRSLESRKIFINNKTKEYDQKLQQLPQRQMEIAILQREKEANESVYSMLLNRVNDSALMESAETKSMGRIAEVLDPAMEPYKPIKPNKKKIAVLALAMGIMIGGGATFLLEYFDRSFHSVDEVVSYLSIPVIATIPKLATYEGEYRKKRAKILKIIAITLASLIVLLIIADIASIQFLTRDSFFLSIVRRVLNLLRKT